MTNSARILLTLIIDYLKTANKANALLSEQLNGNPFELWKNRLVPQKGGCNGLFYFFHGVGCKIETTEFNVDFDYCSDGNIRTFDEWVIRKYLSQKTSTSSDQGFSETHAELVKSHMISETPVGQGGRIHMITRRSNVLQ